MNSSRVHLERENAAFARALPEGSLVLDAGAGDQPYRHLFRHCQYEAADFQMVDKHYAKSTYVCDLAQIPVEDGRFDAVVLNQVLEHLPEPMAVLRELNRVLKTGGRLICTVPLFYEEHEQPFDFYRYTQFALGRVMPLAGFKVERLDWMEGYFGTVAYQFDCAAKYLPIRPRSISPGLSGYGAAVLFAFLKPVLKGLSMILHRLDVAAKYTAKGHPKNYLVIAVKP